MDLQPEYRYYIRGLSAKIFGGIAVSLIYSLYYNGGDTTTYYTDAVCLVKLQFKNPAGFFAVMRDGLYRGNYFYFELIILSILYVLLLLLLLQIVCLRNSKFCPKPQ